MTKEKANRILKEWPVSIPGTPDITHPDVTNFLYIELRKMRQELDTLKEDLENFRGRGRQ